VLLIGLQEIKVPVFMNLLTLKKNQLNKQKERKKKKIISSFRGSIRLKL